MWGFLVQVQKGEQSRFERDGFLIMFYLYILYSASRSEERRVGKEYRLQRLLHHNKEDKSTYTSKHRPWTLKVIFKAGTTRSEAYRIEQWIKKQKSRSLIQKLTDPTIQLNGPLAQFVRVPAVRY